MATTPEVKPVQQDTGAPAPTWYSWTFRADAGAPAQNFEFGMPVTELDAGNRICAWLGIKSLPEGSLVEHRTLTTQTPEPQQMPEPQAPQAPEPEQVLSENE